MIDKLITFLNESKTAYHAVVNASKILDDASFIRLYENEHWNITPGNYYCIRNDSSIIAFSVPFDFDNSFNIIASHTDSPKFKLKSNFTANFDNKYQCLNTECYGGAIYSSWLDKPLSLAGRILTKDGSSLKSSIVDINRDLLLIPNLAIHFNRDINKGYVYNPEIDLKPLLSNVTDLYQVLKTDLNLSKEEIVSFDLELYVRDRAHLFGASNEFINSPQIDNLECMFLSLMAFLNSKSDTFKVFAAFDSEEVGSNTKNGAGSNMLLQILKRVYLSLNKTEEELFISLANSLLLSADNAHALHPNYPSKSDKYNAPIMNEGVVIKYNANQRYTTDSLSAGIFKTICRNSNVKYQEFVNRSDIPGGSTLGNILSSQVSINMVDIGLPQLAMHSARETAGCSDVDYMYDACKEFYETKILRNKDNTFMLKK